MKRYISRIYDSVINPPEDDALTKAYQVSGGELPTLWLLGKTGAGKSTIVQKMTGESAAVIGNGFMPCTTLAHAYDYPAGQPIMRFMDTRGLGEVDYDPAEDLAALGETSHTILIVMRLRDPEQSAVIEALRTIRKAATRLRKSDALLVFTGLEEVSDERDRNRLIEERRGQVSKAWGSAIDHCLTDFHEGESLDQLADSGEAQLREMLAARLPDIGLWLSACEHGDTEKANFDQLSSEVLWYAGAAAGSDAIPLVGLVGVPAIQGKMLHSLAGKYGIEWDKRTFLEFTAALGSGFALSYATSHGARQLVKLIPGYGQIAGSAFAATVSYGVTYALGRAACMYLYHQKTGTPLNSEGLKDVFKDAMSAGKSASKDIQRDQDV
ncbi:MAG: GTPase [Halioglobus sp.]